MRAIWVAIGVVLTSSLAIAQAPAPAPQAQQAPKAPEAQQPVFRAGIELLTVDVTALNNEGRQVTDLGAAEFEVEVDGGKRQVASAEYVRLNDPFRALDAKNTPVPAVDNTYYSTNAKNAQRGRLIVILVDQSNIRTLQARQVMNSAKKFVDTLTPEDQVSVIAVPSPGELVDFTNDKDKVREALLRISGAAATIRARFNISITEAMALYLRNDVQRAQEVISRECAAASSASEIERCEREVEQDAAEIVIEIRRRTDASISSMRGVLQALGAVEGPKSVVVVSEGLILEGLTGDLEDLATVAADARASVDVLLLEVPEFDAAVQQRPTTPREDRELRITGLEMLAGATRGELYRINVSADFAFDRIARGIDGYYLLGVESTPADRNGRRHRINVKSLRRGVSIRSRRTFLAGVSGKATTPADAVSRALRSPLPINDLPMRVSTWIYKEPGTPRVRVLVGAEAERLAAQPLDYTVGMVLIDRNRKGMAPPVEMKTFAEKEGDPGTAVYSAALATTPGTYLLRVALADSEGRVGSVDRKVDVFQLDGPGLALGDLLVDGVTPQTKLNLQPSIEPVVTTGHLAALMELYGAPPKAPGLEAALEIMSDENSRPLATSPMTIAPGASPEITAAFVSFSTAALPPGRYFAKGILKSNGNVAGHLIRPFRVLPPAAAATADAPAATASGALPMEMASVLLGGLPVFDRKELLSPTMLTPIFAAAANRPAASKAALKEAQGGQYGAAAMTALSDNDQPLATFLKGLDLLQQSQLDRAAVQFQSSMQMAPAFMPPRMYLGAALAEANRHREAAGLLQGALAATPTAGLARLAGEEWMKAGQPALAVAPLEQSLKLDGADMRARKLLGVAYAIANRGGEAVFTLTPFLDQNPADQAALLAAIYGAYSTHLSEPKRDTLAADRANVAKWLKAYSAAGGPMPQLVGAWNKYLQDLK